jgi:hypothetical protein
MSMLDSVPRLQRPPPEGSDVGFVGLIPLRQVGAKLTMPQGGTCKLPLNVTEKALKKDG